MTKGEGLLVLQEKMDALDLNKNLQTFGCELTDKIDIKRVMDREQIEIRNRLDHLKGLNLNVQNLIKPINWRPVAGHVMNVCMDIIM